MVWIPHKYTEKMLFADRRNIENWIFAGFLNRGASKKTLCIIPTRTYKTKYNFTFKLNFIPAMNNNNFVLTPGACRPSRNITDRNSVQQIPVYFFNLLMQRFVMY